MTTDEVAELRSQIDDLSAQLDELRGEMLRAQVDQWEARIDATRRAAAPRVHGRPRARGTASRAAAQSLARRQRGAQPSGSAAADALEVLLDGLESAMRELRDAVVASGHAVTR